MGFYTGRSGALFLDATDNNTSSATKILKIRDWSLDTSLELIETTAIDTGVKSYAPGMVASTGSATVMYYRKETGDTGVQFEQLLNKIMKKTTDGVTVNDRCRLTLRVGNYSTTTTDKSGTTVDTKDDISFNAYITSASIKVGTGELSSIAIQFTVDGPFIEVAQS